jgi:hypothetical protein
MMNRQGFVLVCAVVCCLVQAVRAEEKTFVRERLYAWRLGVTLGVAAWGHYRGTHEKGVESLMDDCRALAKGLGVEIPPFPAKKDSDVDNEVLALHYIANTGTYPIGQALAKRYGNDMASLFELTVKSRLAALLYQAKQGDETNADLGEAVARAGKASGLPETLWQPLVRKIKGVAAEEEVRREVTRLDEEVTRHLKAEIDK